MAISGKTMLVGVIGWPIEHSVSPAMHNAAFAALGIDGCYLAFAVPPSRLGEAVLGARALGLRGVNVTVPHKQGALALMDELTPEAARIGAVNTIIFADRGAPDPLLWGHNTDASGFLAALRDTGLEPRGQRALVLGAGGAARAVVYALASVGAEVVIFNRHVERAAALAAEFGAFFPQARLSVEGLTREALARVAPGTELVVNATSLGMAPAVEGSPWPDEAPFPAGALLFDLVYNPRETRLMRQALAAGARAVDGLGMLVHQGAEAFALWTGTRPPAEVMLAACLEVLGGR